MNYYRTVAKMLDIKWDNFDDESEIFSVNNIKNFKFVFKETGIWSIKTENYTNKFIFELLNKTKTINKNCNMPTKKQLEKSYMIKIIEYKNSKKINKKIYWIKDFD